ncbi:MAG: RHS repeat-associated core domain-containing protein [Pyrinomonadaceae bacterium]
MTTDARGVQTHITYGSINGYSGLYPTQTIAGYGTSVARSSAAVYDFYTGVVTTATDVDNGVTSATEYDALGRPIKVRSAAGTPLEAWTRTEYNDAERRVIVRSDLETIGDGRKVAIQHYDQLGRVRLSRTLENPVTDDPYNETHGIKVETRYQTGNPNSFQITSNPFRAAYATQATNEPTMGWTRSKSWNTGRKQQIETFSGAALPAPWGSNTASTGIVTTDIDTNATTVTDQAGKQRRSIENGLGQLIRVDEPDKNTGQLGSVASPIQPTNYSYNTLGKMVHLQQGVQNRYFMYDSLGRILRVRQPEQEVNAGLNTTGNPGNNSWTAGLSYDNNGNVLTATDAKGTTVTNAYDSLNRALTRTYSDGTPTVTNSYDGVGLSPVPSFSKGKLTKVTSSVSESRYTQFDVAGRLLQYQQITDGQTYTSSYEYDLSGGLTMETYPSGRVVENEFNSGGDLSKILGKATPTATRRTYANNFTYSPDGKIERLKLGTGVWESAKFNSRLQVTELLVGRGPASSSIWKMTTEYGEMQTNGTVDFTKNSGNIGKQTVSFDGLAQPFVQTFAYDALQRLTEAKETSNSNQTWKQVFDYDRYGNRITHNKWIGTTPFLHDNKTHPAIDAATNRFQTNQGFTFDANGNITIDADGRRFSFNGENKQTEVRDAQNNVIGQYSYDGEGKRIKKATVTETTIFVYSASKLIAEYSTASPPPNPTTRYTITDQLGSPRVILDSTGDVVSRRDFLPFGEEIDPDGIYRRSDQKFGQTDNVRQKFTGYERDIESDLDFAQARMYNFRHGRFTTVDPPLESATPDNPQSWNRYSYTFNNPLNSVDPTGMMTDFINQDTGVRVHIDDNKDQVIRSNTKQIQQLQALFNYPSDLRKTYHTALGRIENSSQKLNLTVGQFDKLAQAVYGESAATSEGSVRESYGIVNALENRAQAEGTDLMTQVSDAPGYGVYGVRDNRYYTETGPYADTKKLRINKAIALAIPGRDITNGAFFWDGKDFNKNASPNGGYRERYLNGYSFTNLSHDLYKQGNHIARKGPARGGYYYESTAAFGRTTFSRRFNYRGGNWR